MTYLPFTREMVNGLRRKEGPKTQTRRLITTMNTAFDGGAWPAWAKNALNGNGLVDGFDGKSAHVDNGPSPAGNPGPYLHLPYPAEQTSHRIYPRVRTGDTIWVRESLYMDESGTWRYKADDAPVLVTEEDKGAMLVWCHHKESDFCSARFMPRFACRTELDVTEVRLQRLQEISEEDARAEGAGLWVYGELLGEAPNATIERRLNLACRYTRLTDPESDVMTMRGAMAALWDSIHGVGAWERNDWLLAYTFTVDKLDDATDEVGA